MRHHYNEHEIHYNDVIMSMMASQITGISIADSNVLFKCRSKNTLKLCVTGLCEGNSPDTGKFPAQIGKCFHLMKSLWSLMKFLPLLIWYCRSKSLQKVTWASSGDPVLGSNQLSGLRLWVIWNQCQASVLPQHLHVPVHHHLSYIFINYRHPDDCYTGPDSI